MIYSGGVRNRGEEEGVPAGKTDRMKGNRAIEKERRSTVGRACVQADIAGIV